MIKRMLPGLRLLGRKMEITEGYYKAEVDIPTGMWASEFIIDLNEYAHSCPFQNMDGWKAVYRLAKDALTGYKDIYVDDCRTLTLTFRLSNRHDAELLDNLWK